MTVILGVCGLLDNTVSRFEGVILWVFMIIYLLYLLRLAKNGSDTVEEGAKEIARLEKQMKEAARMMEYEYAAILRDQIIELRGGGK